MLTPVSLTCLVALTTGLHIRAEYAKQYTQIYCFKPLTTGLIILLASLSFGLDNSYSLWVILGLFCSMLGDCFLMLKSERFIAGLVSFFLAHCAYIMAFSTRFDVFGHWTQLSMLLAVGLLVYHYLWPEIEGLRSVVAAYILSIVLMGWCAFLAFFATPNTQTLMMVLGAVAFMISDATLAVNKFRVPFPAATAVIMLTYFSAQWLIASSI